MVQFTFYVSCGLCMVWLIFLTYMASCQTIFIYTMIYLKMVFHCELKFLFVVSVGSLFEMFDLPSSVK